MRIFAYVMAVAGALAFAPMAAAVEFVAATPEQGAAVILAEDEFTAEFSPADLSIRLRSPDGGSTGALLALYAGEVRPWTPEEVARIEALIARHQGKIDALARWLPDTILVVKNTDRIDGGFPHTRAAAIFFGPALPQEEARFESLFFHELFHVLSRHNPALHDAMYGVIGFERCARVELPASLRARMVTNPDAPTVNYVLRRGEGADYFSPVLTADPSRWNPAQTSFGSYFDVAFVEFTRGADGSCAAVAEGGGVARLETQAAVEAIFARAGRNTTYFLHPEELMADNFAQMMTGRADAPDPWVYQRLSAVLELPAP